MGVLDEGSTNWRHLQEVLSGFLEEIDSRENISYERFCSGLHKAENILIRNVNNPTPSVFKKGAALVVAFMNESPLRFPFPEGSISRKVLDTPNHQNAVVAF